MKQNVGTVDRTVRVVVGLALVIATLSGAIGAWGWIGVVPIATGLSGWCPAYLPFGFSSCSTKT